MMLQLIITEVDTIDYVSDPTLRYAILIEFGSVGNSQPIAEI